LNNIDRLRALPAQALKATEKAVAIISALRIEIPHSDMIRQPRGERNGAGRSNSHSADGLKRINLRGASARRQT